MLLVTQKFLIVVSITLNHAGHGVVVVDERLVDGAGCLCNGCFPQKTRCQRRHLLAVAGWKCLMFPVMPQ